MCKLKGWQKFECAQLGDSAVPQKYKVSNRAIKKPKLKIKMSTPGNHDFFISDWDQTFSIFSPIESKVQSLIFFSFLVWTVETFWLKINILTFPSQNVYMWFVNKIRLEIAKEEVFMWGLYCTSCFLKKLCNHVQVKKLRGAQKC